MELVEHRCATVAVHDQTVSVQDPELAYDMAGEDTLETGGCCRAWVVRVVGTEIAVAAGDSYGSTMRPQG